MSSRGGLPPRWKNCPRFGEVVANVFLPFKVPLDDSYSSLLAPSMYFTPTMLVNYGRHNNINIGLWIDLTFTDRFYDKTLVEKEKIGYVKLKCRGHAETPSPDQTQTFIDLCSRFLVKNPDKIIAVHCTHGFNRTGFLICAYLVDQENWSIEAAISAFSRCRPPGIYKQDYLNELFRLYGDGDQTAIILAPPLPEWCNEDNHYQDDEASVNESYGPGSSSANGNRQQTKVADPFLEGIDGIVMVFEQDKITTLRETCTDMCKFKLKGFPGCQPVSLTHQNLNFLQEEYMVSWKADGNRYMMLIMDSDQMYFFDRDYSIFQIFNLNFLRRNSKERLTETLLDGEMVVDVVDGQRFPRFLIYDIVYCDGQDVSERNFRDRLNIIYKQIIMPRESAKRSGQIDRSKEPFGVRMKDFCELKNTYKFFEPKFQRDLSHEIDGLIFQPVHLPYIAGRCDRVLKWKPPTHNSVDFLLKIVEETRPGRVEKYLGQLYVGGKREPFAYINVTQELRKHNNRIIECRFNMQKNGWEFMRERTDKSYPNALSTASNVVYSIQYPITRQYLLDYLHKHSFK
ncbi:mRNA-capping enzyme [Dermatophagoides farinae]|uniref:mRNA-capping enzyme n=1 Tax=Dermatophagoides farinae TaxID=6954 RepID=A0A922HXG9_DERFA|nr:mRNA-capping enzyme-like [Dermatophagoides farinae]KAH7636958.1 mrna-capping enzyme-like protein [Dermatophagoides farinae]KAH9510702.1 hypothetical protein DERF_009211 [Dermatophagoides farinae]